MVQRKQKRRRGVILTVRGLQKLHAAKSRAEIQENFGQRYTLERLSERTGLAVDTLMRLLACETGVDKQTLKRYFRAFNLVLEPTDYTWPIPQTQQLKASESVHKASQGNGTQVSETVTVWPHNRSVQPVPPGGQVPLDSAFYIERPPIESRCYEAVLQPGALIRIASPPQMGKTSLMVRILNWATLQDYRTVSINFQLADNNVFQNLDTFLRWFCANVGLSLQLPNQLGERWDIVVGSKISCHAYFEQYLLPEIGQPLVLGLDEINRLFQYPALANDFLGLLYAWHEAAKDHSIWQQMRLIVAYSPEVDILPIASQWLSNTGLSIELPELNNDQVQELAKRHGLDWSATDIKRLVAFAGRNPYRVRLALYHIWRQDITLQEMLQASPTAIGIYQEHLHQQLWALKQHPELVATFAQVVTASAELEPIKAFQLRSMGLICMQGKRATPSCELYRQYFQACLS